MPVVWFKPFGVCDLRTRGVGMVLHNGVALGKRAAPNRLTRSVRRAFRTGDCRPPAATPQKPLRADAAVTQNRQLDPRRVTARRRRLGEGIETLVWRLLPRVAASASLVAHSLVGPHRSQSVVGARRGISFGLKLSPAAGRRPGGQSKRDGVGREPQRDREVEPQTIVAPARSPWLPQLGRRTPRPGRRVRIKVRSCV